jgi:hypothetical protein
MNNKILDLAFFLFRRNFITCRADCIRDMPTVLSYGTGKQAYFDLFMESCHRFGIEPVILGWGEKWVGSGEKLIAICNYVKDLPADEIVISVDPFDVIFLSDTGEIESKFRRMRRPFLCGALKLTSFNARVYDHEFNRTPWTTPGNPTGYNYLNAGTWISTAGYARRILEGLIDAEQLAPANVDQEILTATYLEDRSMVDIDWKCEIFYNLLFRNFITRKPDLSDLRFDHGRIRNGATGTLPSILHASGNVFMKEIALLLGYDPSLTVPEDDMRCYVKKVWFHAGKVVKYAIIQRGRLAWA